MLSRLFPLLLSTYPDYLKLRVPNARHEVHELLCQTIPKYLESISPEPHSYKFQGSDGDGYIALVPWVAIFHRAVTVSARNGFYVVWLLPVERDSIVLELGLGATQFVELYGENKNALDAIGRASSKMLGISRPMMADIFSSEVRGRLVEGEIEPLGPHFRHRAYGKAAILSFRYPLKEFPSESVITDDLTSLIRLYSRLALSPLLPSIEQLVDDEVLSSANTVSDRLSITTAKVFKNRQAQTSEKSLGQRRLAIRYAKESKTIGDLGERLVVDWLKQRLRDSEKGHLADKVIWHQEDLTNQKPGWDITAYSPETGELIYVEVKATRGNFISSLTLTNNEWERAKEHGDRYWIYIVTNVFQSPALEMLQDPAGGHLKGLFELSVTAWEFRLSPPATA